jgi:hypothetical protein
VSDPALDPEEDSELRRLHMLKGFGMVAGSVMSRYEALRGRDRRKGVRLPDEATVVTPITKDTFAKAKPAPAKWGSDPQHVIADTRDILAERPEPRRGRGIFRR